MSAESPNENEVTSGPSYPLMATYEAHILSTAWSARASYTVVTLTIDAARIAACDRGTSRSHPSLMRNLLQ